MLASGAEERALLNATKSYGTYEIVQKMLRITNVNPHTPFKKISSVKRVKLNLIIEN